MAPPSSSKRKRDDNDDAESAEAMEADHDGKVAVAPRSSKKSKLEEAKRRAKEWGLQDKKKLEASKVKHLAVEQSSASPPPAASKGPAPEPSAPETTIKSTKTPPRKARASSSTTKKSSTTGTTSTTAIGATKATAAKSKSTPTAPRVAQGTVVTGSTTGTTTNNNSNISSSSSTPVISATPANTPIPSMSSQAMPNNPFATGTVPVNPDFMAQYMMTHQPPAALFPQPAYSQPAPAGYVPAAPLHPSHYPYSALVMQQQQLVAQQLSSSKKALSKQSTPLSTAIPPLAPSSHSNVKPSSTVSKKKAPPSAARPDSPSSDDELIPPPPTLQMQISQQVLANASASLKNEPAPHTQPPPEAFCPSSYPQDADDDDEQSESYEHDDQPIIVDVDDLPLENISTTVGHPTTFTPWFVLVVAVALVVSLLAANIPSTTHPSTIRPTTEVQAEVPDLPCYQDSQPQYQMIGDGDEMQTILIQPCENLDTMVPCPSLGFCQDGKLVRCTHESFQVNATGTGCELTPATQQEIVALWMAALEERTIADLCVAGGSHAELPLFEYQKLQLLYPSTLAIHPLDKTVMQTAFATHEEQGRWFIGLPDDHTIILPLRCRMAHSISKLLKTILAWIGLLCWKSVTLATRLMWSMMSSYPLISFIGLLTVLGVRQVQSFQKHRINLVKDVAKMRDMAFDRLQDDADTAHAVLHLRDDIVATLTAHDNFLNGFANQQRHYWITSVWPKVIPQLQQDNRIKKTQRVELGGKRRDYWQWVAASRSTTKSKKHVSIAMTTTTTTSPRDGHDKKKKVQ